MSCGRSHVQGRTLAVQEVACVKSTWPLTDFNVSMLHTVLTQSYVSETILGPIPANGPRLDWSNWSFAWIFRRRRLPTTWYLPWGLWCWLGRRSRVIKWRIWCRRHSSIFSNIASKAGLSRLFRYRLVWSDLFLLLTKKNGQQLVLSKRESWFSFLY